MDGIMKKIKSWFKKEEKPSKLELILYGGGFSKHGKEGNALVLEDPFSTTYQHEIPKHKILTRDKGEILAALPLPDGTIVYTTEKLTYGKGFDHLVKRLDPATGETEILARRKSSSYGLSQTPDGKILLPESFGSRKISPYKSKSVYGLILLDPDTKKQEVLTETDEPISTAIALPDGKIAMSTKDIFDKETGELKLYDPRSNKFELLAKEDGRIYAISLYDNYHLLYGGALGNDCVCSQLKKINLTTKESNVVRQIIGGIYSVQTVGDKYIVPSYENTLFRNSETEVWVFDPKSFGHTELVSANRTINTAVPVSKKQFGYLLE